MNMPILPAGRRVAAALALALAACSAQPAATPPLAGARIGGPFTLTDQHGRTVTDRDFAGRYRIVYFGYTFCPDVCPVDVQNISAALKLVEAKDAALGKRIRLRTCSRMTVLSLAPAPGLGDIRRLAATASPSRAGGSAMARAPPEPQPHHAVDPRLPLLDVDNGRQTVHYFDPK